MKHRVVLVTWWDAHAVTTGWTNIDELDVEPFVVTSVGYLVEAAKPDHVLLVQSVTREGQIDQALAIPWGMVRSVVMLTGPIGSDD